MYRYCRILAIFLVLSIPSVAQTVLDMTALPVVVDQPGSYVLAGDVSVADGVALPAIEIAAEGVVLDMQGWTLFSDATGTSPLVAVTADDVSIIGGTIVSSGADSIAIGASGVRLLKLLRLDVAGPIAVALADSDFEIADSTLRGTVGVTGNGRLWRNVFEQDGVDCALQAVASELVGIWDNAFDGVPCAISASGNGLSIARNAIDSTGNGIEIAAGSDAMVQGNRIVAGATAILGGSTIVGNEIKSPAAVGIDGGSEVVASNSIVSDALTTCIRTDAPYVAGNRCRGGALAGSIGIDYAASGGVLTGNDIGGFAAGLQLTGDDNAFGGNVLEANGRPFLDDGAANFGRVGPNDLRLPAGDGDRLGPLGKRSLDRAR